MVFFVFYHAINIFVLHIFADYNAKMCNFATH